MGRTLVLIAVVALSCAPATANDTTYELDPLFTLGLDDEVLLGRPVDVALHPDGPLLVLDRQLSHLLVVDTDGTVLREIGREGQGPGELTMPFDLHLEPDGTIAVAQTPPAHLERFGVDGSVLESTPLELGAGLRIPVRLHRHDDALVLEMSLVEIEGQSVTQATQLGILDPTTGDLQTLARHATEIDMVKSVVREGDTSPYSEAWTVTPTGAVVWASDRIEYDVRRHDPVSGEVATLTRPGYEPRLRSDARKQEMIDASESAMERAGTGLRMRFVPTDEAPYVQGILARPDDSVWVRRTPRSLPGFEEDDTVDSLVFDRFDAGGTFVGEVRIGAPAWMADARVFLFDDLLVAIHVPTEGGDDDPLRPVTVDAFRLRRTS